MSRGIHVFKMFISFMICRSIIVTDTNIPQHIIKGTSLSLAHTQRQKINGYLTWKENIHWGEFTTTFVICSPEFVVCVYTCHTVMVNWLTQTLNWCTSCLLQWFQNTTCHHPERLINRTLIINLFLRVCFCSLWHVQWNSKTSWLMSGVKWNNRVQLWYYVFIFTQAYMQTHTYKAL